MNDKRNKQQIKNSVLAEYFYMHKTQISRHLKSGLRLDYIYIVLNRPDLTTKEKRNYIFNTSMSFSMKENIWSRYQGDYGFAYCQQKSNSLEFEIIQEGGAV